MFKSYLLVVIIAALHSTVLGQAHNTYIFIEPNISISYDSTVFNHGPHYINTTYETESFDFFFKDDTLHSFSIHIEANYSDYIPSIALQDSFISKEFEEVTSLQNDTLAIEYLDKKPVQLNGFSCLRYLFHEKSKNEYAVMITGLRLFDGGYCQVSFISKDKKDVQKESDILLSFLKGFNYYTKNRADSEEVRIKQLYSVVVDSNSRTVDNNDFRQFSYRGIVRIKEKLQHKVAEVRITNSLGQEIFSPNEHGEVPITCYDTKPGTITKYGEFVLFNSFGKKVKIPFTFAYENKAN